MLIHAVKEAVNSSPEEDVKLHGLDLIWLAPQVDGPTESVYLRLTYLSRRLFQ